MDSRIQEILHACKAGMTKTRIDSKCKGHYVRALERGEKVSEEKLDQMYTNVLLYKEGIMVPSYSQRNRKRSKGDNFIDHRIQEILRACHEGMTKRKIDSKCDGRYVRALERGEKVSEKKLEQMYANVLLYKKGIMVPSYSQHNRKRSEGAISDDVSKKHLVSYSLVKLNPEIKISTEQKREVIKEAIASGVPKSYIGQNSSSIVYQLLSNRQMRATTIDRLYENLLATLRDKSKPKEPASKIQSMSERIQSLETYTASLIEQVSHLKSEVNRLNKLQKSAAASTVGSKRPRKILGLTVTLRTSKTHGKTYKRWNAIAKKDGKRKMIYIGNDLSKAKQKIRAGLSRLGIV